MKHLSYICTVKTVITQKMVEIDKIYCEDCLQTMSRMEDNSIDLVVTSCPYDNLRKYNGFSFDFENTAKELFRILKDGGVVVWVVNDSTVKGSETLTSFKHALYFKEIGFNVNDTMIWQKANPLPQVKQPRYNQCFEYMFIFSKGKPKTFNPIQVECKCAGQKYQSTCKNMGGENGRTKKNFNINKTKTDNNIWTIAVAQNNTPHPAVFPLELALRHIKSWSNKSDIVYDPFIGSGTTAVAAKMLDRRYIGSDISEEYCHIAENRIETECKFKLM